MKKNIKVYWFLLIPVVLLLGALGDWPYSYYQLLRWTVFGTTAYAGYLSYESGSKNWALILACIAVLFNPIAPFYLSKDTWQLFDAITALLIISFVISKKDEE